MNFQWASDPNIFAKAGYTVAILNFYELHCFNFCQHLVCCYSTLDTSTIISLARNDNHDTGTIPNIMNFTVTALARW